MIPVSHSINSLKHTCQLAGDMEPGDALVCGVIAGFMSRFGVVNFLVKQLLAMYVAL